MPLNPQANTPCTEASLLQAIITWSKSSSLAPLELALTPDSPLFDDQLEKFIRKQPSGLVASAMASAVCTQANGHHIRIHPLIEKHLEAFRSNRRRETQLDLFALDRSEWDESTIPAMGPKIFLPCIDHFPNGRIPHLYCDRFTLRSRLEFNNLIELLVKKLCNSAVNGEWRGLPFRTDLMLGLCRIIYELFDNTHKWAVDDALGQELNRSSRGILIKLHSNSPDEANYKDHPQTPLSRYLLHQCEQGEAARLIEVSIFDSGPGLAARRLQRRLTTEDSTKREFVAICECFRKHSTTSNQPGRGLGLHYMMKTLTELRGFVRLRTGRLCLYRDLVNRPVMFHEGWFNTAMEDWYGKSDFPTELRNAEGTVFNVLLPV
jgi:hypothetical protein